MYEEENKGASGRHRDSSLSYLNECQPRETQAWHSFGKEMQNLLSSWGRFCHFILRLVKMSEFQSILCKAFDTIIKDILFTDGNISRLSFSFLKFR